MVKMKKEKEEEEEDEAGSIWKQERKREQREVLKELPKINNTRRRRNFITG